MKIILTITQRTQDKLHVRMHVNGVIACQEIVLSHEEWPPFLNRIRPDEVTLDETINQKSL